LLAKSRIISGKKRATLQCATLKLSTIARMVVDVAGVEELD
jgi:hypothetical protein